ncbi:hypothetical protein F5878DRAFT_709282 [Lentinula raphanica]|uniref:Uncharacterized protein n=1 Tax=Lentinula raphanica TaxID=153919 RepID=A0AA38PB57_9AGAR|nr:hypothetical protein F5878DRAFT_709282 [Lentinula raphanica]
MVELAGHLCAESSSTTAVSQLLPDITNDEQAAQYMRRVFEPDHRAIRERLQIQQPHVEVHCPLIPKGVGIKSLPVPIHPYAKALMTARKYVPLWYFLPVATAEGRTGSRDYSVDHGHCCRRSSATLIVRASLNEIPDSQLAWSQIRLAKAGFLEALKLGDYTSEYITMFTNFYTNMDIHPEMCRIHGERVMIHYHSEMRMAWYDAFERGEPFDLAVISKNVLQECRYDIESQIHQERNESIQAASAATAAAQAQLDQFSENEPVPHRYSSRANHRTHPYRYTSPRKGSFSKDADRAYDGIPPASAPRSFRRSGE